MSDDDKREKDVGKKRIRSESGKERERERDEEKTHLDERTRLDNDE